MKRGAWRGIAALALSNMAHFYSLCSIFSYAGFLAVDCGWASDTDTAGFAAGLLPTFVMLGRLCTSVPWGRAADRYGRRPCMLASMAAVAIGNLCFGLTTNLGAALAVRFLLLGAANGWVSLMGLMTLEIAGEDYQAQAFSYVISAGSVVAMAGPALGGWLYGALGPAFPALPPSLIGAALLLAWGLHKALPAPERRREIAEEWPSYRVPRIRLVAQNMFRQGAAFVRSAGQVIVVLSVVLWTLGFLGPGTLAERQAMAPSVRLESSVLGAVGDAIEPVVTPLGYDGRLGIAVLSSFAAREVFVGTVQTLYPSPDGSTPKVSELKSRLAREIHPRTGRPLLTTASAASLIVFYMFAMQCLSTLAVVRSELKSWGWALAQTGGLTLLAYVLAWLTHVLLS